MTYAMQLQLSKSIRLMPPQVRGIKGTRGNLCRVLSDYPQKIRNRVGYVLAGGWAVELVTGRRREHKDIDIIVLRPDFDVETDNQRPKSYFGQLSIPLDLFKRECAVSIGTDLPIYRPKGFPYEGLTTWVGGCDPDGEVLIASPELIAVAKLSGGWGGEPAREKDIYDCVNLLRKSPRTGFPIMSEALSRFAFAHLKGLPADQVEGLAKGFIGLNRRIFAASWLEAEGQVRDFHQRLRDLVGPNREGTVIEQC